MENRFNIQSDEEGKRLDVFLAEKLSITRSKVKEIFDNGLVRIAGKIPKPSLKVRKGYVIEGAIPEEKPTSLMPQEIYLDILYEDEYLLAVDKPKGMVVHPSFGHSEGTLVNAILGYLQRAGDGRWAIPSTSGHVGDMVRPGIVHRLDKGTTGVILIAKDLKTQEMLSSLFKERIVQKTYRAIVEGIVRKNEGIIAESIGRHPIQRKKMAVVKRRGRESETAYKILQKLDGFTYIEAYPRTGRTHQIRVHLAHIGHPVVGDEAYGRKAKHATDRTLLHAYTIFFPHPVKGSPIVIQAPVPEDMTKFLAEHEGVKIETREISSNKVRREK
jgi:23S rRNA pseudouridine1911/1915/1917 synthase